MLVHKKERQGLSACYDKERDDVFIVGGNASQILGKDKTYPSVFRFSRQSRKIAKLPDLKTARYQAHTLTFNGLLYIIAGYDLSAPQKVINQVELMFI